MCVRLPADAWNVLDIQLKVALEEALSPEEVEFSRLQTSDKIATADLEISAS